MTTYLTELRRIIPDARERLVSKVFGTKDVVARNEFLGSFADDQVNSILNSHRFR
jgi:hypothetical protein